MERGLETEAGQSSTPKRALDSGVPGARDIIHAAGVRLVFHHRAEGARGVISLGAITAARVRVRACGADS